MFGGISYKGNNSKQSYENKTENISNIVISLANWKILNILNFCPLPHEVLESFFLILLRKKIESSIVGCWGDVTLACPHLSLCDHSVWRSPLPGRQFHWPLVIGFCLSSSSHFILWLRSKRSREDSWLQICFLSTFYKAFLCGLYIVN